jgi:hypothetical protein
MPKTKRKVKAKPVKTTRKPRNVKLPKVLSPKELATQRGEPYIAVVNVDVDSKDINSGAFEFDWNEKFIVNLIKAGFKIKEDDTDQDLIDRWFLTVCRNVSMEVFEQHNADPDNRLRIVRSRSIGDGRTEVS